MAQQLAERLVPLYIQRKNVKKQNLGVLTVGWSIHTVLDTSGLDSDDCCTIVCAHPDKCDKSPGFISHTPRATLKIINIPHTKREDNGNDQVCAVPLTLRTLVVQLSLKS